MTVKELKKALQDISEPIDRIAGFCDDYDQMFERCQINFLEDAVQIDTIEDLFEPDSYPAVHETIAEILALPADLDGYAVQYEGDDNQDESSIVYRAIRRFAVMRGSTGVGISLQGSEFGKLNPDICVTKIFIKGESAYSLNKLFWDFMKYNSTHRDGAFVKEVDDGVFIEFSSYEAPSSAIIAKLASMFNELLFCRTPMNINKDVSYRLTNDHKGQYWRPFAAVFIPADNRYSKWYKCDNVHELDELLYLKQECCSMAEADQFLAMHNPDLELGDMIVRIESRYIDNPLDLVLKPSEDNLE